jgi:hypothetical protein
MNLQGQLGQFMVDPTLVADYLVVAGGSGGHRGGFGDSGNGGNGGQVVSGSARFPVGSYSVTVGAGGAAGAWPSTTDAAGSNSVLGSIATATGAARNLIDGDGTGASGSGRTGVSSSITGSAIEYGTGGISPPSPPYGNNGAAVTANRGHGGNGGEDGDPDEGGNGSAGASGVVHVWYGGAARGTGGTISSVNGGTLHTFNTSGTLVITG